jgi:hypothetical protein
MSLNFFEFLKICRFPLKTFENEVVGDSSYPFGES